MYFNERPIGVELPTFVALKIVETDPAFRGDTVTGGSKPAMRFPRGKMASRAPWPEAPGRP